MAEARFTIDEPGGIAADESAFTKLRSFYAEIATVLVRYGFTSPSSRVIVRDRSETADIRVIRRDQRLPIALALLVFAVVYALYIAGGTFRADGRLVGSLFDDALISLRYAQHLSRGAGLVWNVGERPPVEGFTNFGWTLAIALLTKAVPSYIAPIGVSLLGAALLLGAGLVTVSLLREVGVSVSARTAGMILVLAAYPTVFWTLRGMEVGALSLLLLLAIRTAVTHDDDAWRRPLVVGTIAGIALLTRNDAVLTFLPVLTYVVWRQHRRLVAAATAAVPVVVCAAGQILFRWLYFGQLAPNTYILKMTGVATATRWAAGATAVIDTLAPIAPAVAIIAVAACATRVHERVRDLSRLALATLGVQWAYLVWIGGDAWLINYSNRFVAAVLPALLVAAVAAIPTCDRVLRRDRTAAGWFVSINLLLLCVLGVHHPHAFARGPQWLLLGGWVLILSLGVAASLKRALVAPTVTAGVAAFALFLATSGHGWLAWAIHGAPKVADDIAFARLGLMLGDRLPANAVIATGWVGAPAYYSEHPVVDLLGKTDAHVARAPAHGSFRPGHNKMDLPYSLGQLRPDVVVSGEPDIAGYRYDRLANGLWVRQDSPVRDALGLDESWCTAPSDSVYCPGLALPHPTP
jgi:arabinofuranosyltransferase